jgi:hypothetical protein
MPAPVTKRSQQYQRPSTKHDKCETGSHWNEHQGDCVALPPELAQHSARAFKASKKAKHISKALSRSAAPEQISVAEAAQAKAGTRHGTAAHLARQHGFLDLAAKHEHRVEKHERRQDRHLHQLYDAQQAQPHAADAGESMRAPLTITYHGRLYRQAVSPTDDPADIAAHILDQGKLSAPLARIEVEWTRVLAKVAHAKQENDGLRRAGAGNTEAARLVGMEVLPALERMIKVAQTVLTQLKPLMKT